MENIMKAEVEMNLNQTTLRLYLSEKYQDDYQIPMLKHNQIPGILEFYGCEVEGISRYTYEVSGMTAMKTLYEQTPLRKQAMEVLVKDLLETVEKLRLHMLNPDCLLLLPEYIFLEKERWQFCYLPGYSGTLGNSFHELTEYFVKTLDYSEEEGIFLAYELHKATLQEHYNLSVIMKEFEEHQQIRSRESETANGTQEIYGNVFSLIEEEEVHSAAVPVRETGNYRSVWRKAMKHFPGKHWGKWDDLILETDGQEKNTAL